jgi:hypothetical protein
MEGGREEIRAHFLHLIYTTNNYCEINDPHALHFCSAHSVHRCPFSHGLGVDLREERLSAYAATLCTAAIEFELLTVARSVSGPVAER